ncbi:3',5'-cyclic-nucleotide phosphodiesterase [Noviherbaspirillum denitrificans]|uniref:Metallo-beta-lactamase domain-containing protein n=1 Tax=Noviherbaspirillum denitrificans TaxID=1968433 RepID=A0A254TBW6_9BURK|nr:3',5'-cyclic-nucleotide phosphodiesterase [Noviherbaspirillum denitrificans]OWW18772.1 hypothetical protein AYR66_04210 [Noviherbaspirillum denitrificans]
MTNLGVEELVRIDHVFITHSHLDHVAGLALLVDSIQGKRTSPITVHGTEKVIASLKKHLFNWVLWPDFAAIPSNEQPSLRWQTVEPGKDIVIGSRRLTPHAVNHTVGSAAYLVNSARAGFIFTGDMASTPELWTALKAEKKLSKVIVDCSFTNADMELAAKSMHFCPRSLIDDIRGVDRSVEFLIYHLKPGQEDQIMRELADDGEGRPFRALKCGDEFIF